MLNKSRGANGEGDSRMQVNSGGKDNGDHPGAIDMLAIWIAEDVMAFAKSFDTRPAEVLKEAMERIRAESLLE